MMRGLPASIIFHAAVVAAGYVGWPFMTATIDFSESVPVPVELVDIGALNNIAPVLKPTPEPEEEIVPDEPEEEPVEEPVPEDPVDETLPEDEVDTASVPEEMDEAEPEEVVPDLDAKPEETPEPKEPEPEPEQQVTKPVDPLDDFLSQADSTFESERNTRKTQEPPKPQQRPLLEDTPPAPQQVRKGAGERNANTARLESVMYNKIFPCWDGVSDQPNPEKLNVTMALTLNREGNVDDLRLVSPGRRPLGNSPMGTAVDRALRAVRKCAPYNLPDDEYATWREIKVNLGQAFTSTKQQ